MLEFHDTVRLYSTQLCGTGVNVSCSLLLKTLGWLDEKSEHPIPFACVSYLKCCEICMQAKHNNYTYQKTEW